MIYKLLFLTSTITILLLSCYHENHPKVDTPEHLISRDDMVNVLTDIYVTEGILTYHRMNQESTDEISTNYYKKVFQEHQITHRILKDNLRYYNSSPEEMEEILDEVLAKLSKMQAEITAMKEDVHDTISGTLYDTLPDNYIPSIFYQENWSFTSLIDTLLMMPLDSVPEMVSDSTLNN
jgi:hypothetical protein